MTDTLSPAPTEAQMLPVERVAAVLDVSVRTVERMVRRGEFPAPRKLGRRSLWPRAVVEQWMLDPASVLPAAEPQVVVPAVTSAPELETPVLEDPIASVVGLVVTPATNSSSAAEPVAVTDALIVEIPPVLEELPTPPVAPELPAVAPEAARMLLNAEPAPETPPTAPEVAAAVPEIVPTTPPEAPTIALAAVSAPQTAESPPNPDPAARRVIGEILAAILDTRPAPSAVTPVPAPPPVVPVVTASPLPVVAPRPVAPTAPVRTVAPALPPAVRPQPSAGTPVPVRPDPLRPWQPAVAPVRPVPTAR